MARTKITLENKRTGNSVSVMAENNKGHLSLSKRQYEGAAKKLKIDRVSPMVCTTPDIARPIMVYAADGISGHATLY